MKKIYNIPYSKSAMRKEGLRTESRDKKLCMTRDPWHAFMIPVNSLVINTNTANILLITFRRIFYHLFFPVFFFLYLNVKKLIAFFQFSQCSKRIQLSMINIMSTILNAAPISSAQQMRQASLYANRE